MKNVIVICLLAAIGAIFFIEAAHAQQGQSCFIDNGVQRCRPSGGPGFPQQPPQGDNRFSNSHNEFPGQQNRDYQQGYQNRDYPQGYQQGDRRDGFHDGYRDRQPGFYFGLNVAPPPPVFDGRCGGIAQRLGDQGFRNIRPLSCVGGTYVYRARRGGERLTLYVSSRSGRIRRIDPAY